MTARSSTGSASTTRAWTRCARGSLPDVVDPAWSAPLVAHTEQLLPTLDPAPPAPAAEQVAVEEPPRPEPVLVASLPLPVFEAPPEPPATELETELAAVDAVDPFSSFWLDAGAPMPAGLTAGYLPPLAGMWSTPAGETL